jgi:hypothetical protein
VPLGANGSPAIVPSAIDPGRAQRWWSYSRAGEHGHRWGPGEVILSWSPRDCDLALAEPGRGHVIVSCQAPGCRSRRYKPHHDPQTLTWEPGRAGR